MDEIDGSPEGDIGAKPSGERPRLPTLRTLAFLAVGAVALAVLAGFWFSFVGLALNIGQGGLGNGAWILYAVVLLEAAALVGALALTITNRIPFRLPATIAASAAALVAVNFILMFSEQLTVH
jgi:hypothetical protein